jgi:hypothetical protein
LELWGVSFELRPAFGFHTAAKIEGAGSQWGTGGMETKITAARLATASGVSLAAPTVQLILFGYFFSILHQQVGD